jgi:hypothetical protein
MLVKLLRQASGKAAPPLSDTDVSSSGNLTPVVVWSVSRRESLEGENHNKPEEGGSGGGFWKQVRRSSKEEVQDHVAARSSAARGGGREHSDSQDTHLDPEPILTLSSSQRTHSFSSKPTMDSQDALVFSKTTIESQLSSTSSVTSDGFPTSHHAHKLSGVDAVRVSSPPTHLRATPQLDSSLTLTPTMLHRVDEGTPHAENLTPSTKPEPSSARVMSSPILHTSKSQPISSPRFNAAAAKRRQSSPAGPFRPSSSFRSQSDLSSAMSGQALAWALSSIDEKVKIAPEVAPEVTSSPSLAKKNKVRDIIENARGLLSAHGDHNSRNNKSTPEADEEEDTSILHEACLADFNIVRHLGMVHLSVNLLFLYVFK